ncbi:MAG: carbohydrate kinase family protein [Promethearchaeota archaeon]
MVAGKLSIDDLAKSGKRFPPVLGGSAAHAALAAATAGCQVAIVASIGNDFPPKFIDILRSKGIDLSGVVKRVGSSSHFMADFESDGSMSRYGLRFGVGNQLSLKHYSRLTEEAQAVHLGILPPHLQKKLLKRVSHGDKLLSMTTIFHQARQYRDRILPQLPFLDILFLNEEEARILSNQNEILQAIELLGNTIPLVVVTQGSKGCLINESGQISHVPSFSVEEVDQVGAGDSFAGAFLASYIKDGDVHVAAKWGNAAGALNVSAIGSTRMASATRNDLLSLIE